MNAAVTTAVPALSKWGVAALALLLAMAVYGVLRIPLGGKPLASLVLAGALGWGVVAGVPALRSAMAAVALPVALTYF
ncbi:hypothetical protein GCM10027082_47320 [Comamonas humi]